MIRPLLEKTPYELLKDRKPNLAHLRAFSSKYFVHNNEKKTLEKFARIDEGVFLGYSLHRKAYKMYNKITMCAKESVHESLNETGHLAKRGMKDDDGKIGSTHLYENRPDQGPPKNVSEQQDIEQQPDSMEVEDGGQEKGGIKHAHDVPTDNNEPGPSADQEENHGNQGLQVRNWKHKSSHQIKKVLTPVDFGMMT